MPSFLLCYDLQTQPFPPFPPVLFFSGGDGSATLYEDDGMSVAYVTGVIEGVVCGAS
jgi:hypothetical protein